MLGKEFRLLIIALLVLVFAICRGIILAAGNGGEVGVREPSGPASGPAVVLLSSWPSP